MINPKEHPLVFVQTIQSIFTQIRDRVIKHSSIVRITNDQNLKIVIEDLDPLSNFSFEIFEPDFQNHRVIFQIKQTPTNNVRLAPNEYALNSDQILRNLDSWINIIKQYNNIQISPEDIILKAYEDEFYCNFELVDEDANEKPFKLDKQLMLTEFIDSTIITLNNQEIVDENLISEALEIKKDLPNLTKQATVKRLSMFFALVRKKSLPLLKDIFHATKSELIKQAISGGIEIMKGIL